MTAARRWVDPFEDMSDEEFDAHVDVLFAARRRNVGVSLRVPHDLLERLRREAGRAGVPYQTLMKALLEAAVARLEHRSAAPHDRRTGSPRKTSARRGARS